MGEMCIAPTTSLCAALSCWCTLQPHNTRSKLAAGRNVSQEAQGSVWSLIPFSGKITGLWQRIMWAGTGRAAEGTSESSNVWASLKIGPCGHMLSKHCSLWPSSTSTRSQGDLEPSHAARKGTTADWDWPHSMCTECQEQCLPHADLTASHAR